MPNGNGVGNGMGNCGQNNGQGNDGMDNGFGNGNHNSFPCCFNFDPCHQNYHCFTLPKDCENHNPHHYTGRGDCYIRHDHCEPIPGVPEPSSYILAGIAVVMFLTKKYIFG